MNTPILLGLGSPAEPMSDSRYWIASIVAFILTVGFVLLFRRTVGRPTARKKGKPSTRALLMSGAMALPLSPAVARAEDPALPPPSIAVSAFVETYISWNFNKPENGLTAFRGFDTRHNSFALSNAVLDTRWAAGPISGRLALQAGDTPDTYYGAEATSDVRHVLEATIAWKAPAGRGLTLDGGIFLSPIGPEGVPVKDNWTWSRSTLFYALPFYHAGFRATYPVSDRWNVTAGVYNGWSNVTDTNGKKSISVQGLYTKPDKVTASLLYFGGGERARGSAEGEPWRNLFDSHITVTVSPSLSVQLHADTGFENTTFGRASWRAGALAARVKANSWLYVAGRADALAETTPTSSAGTAATLFFPTKRVRSLTATLDARPADRMAIRLEYRRDSAHDPIYFEKADETPSAKSQSTLTFGLTAWF